MSRCPCAKTSSVAKMESLEEDSVIVVRIVTIGTQWHTNGIKRQALALYMKGLGFWSIGRLLNCSHVDLKRIM